MARPNQEAIDTLMGITGVSESLALQILEEHNGDLNEAVNAHFNGGERNTIHGTSTAASHNDAMDIDEPIQVGSRGPPFSLLSNTRNFNLFSLLDPNFSRSLFDGGPDFSSRAPVISHPREVREIPVEVKDGSDQSGHSVLSPAIGDVTGTAHAHGRESHGPVIIDDDNIPTATSGCTVGQNEQIDDLLGNSSHGTYPRSGFHGIDDLPDYHNDIEEEMVRAAIEASKREVGEVYLDQQFGAHDDLSNPRTQQTQSHVADAELAHAVSLSLKTAEEEKALRELGETVGASELEAYNSTEMVDKGKMPSSSGRLEVGNSSIQDVADGVEGQPLVGNTSRLVPSTVVDSGKEIGEVEVRSPSSPRQHENINHPQHSDEWGGISSEEHDEAIMLEAALFGGVPEGNGYPSSYAPYQFMQNGLDRTLGYYPQRMPRPPSPGLAAQRSIREQQDDEYLASLRADREKELKAIEEAEARRLKEQAAREAALEEKKLEEEKLRRKLEEEQEMERQLAAKEVSLPQEPTSDDENAVTLLVRMPDGSRHGRPFLKSDKLQSLFDFIDVGRGVKPGTYRLVRPYPRRAFSDGECAATLKELGLTSKQEALFLELI
ncbi:Plant UBX domain-containing protein 8 [Camellia lanceoleosa]|uniref:Plant UBX domain-containing protein 8 n=1 Tax=Camellia lanceoleosa TaxID=1840588 RepID=A0ACC0G3J6_9ERIC|nr:Plant UBX domain-containing protein 8 [Camellia lanceoleosa]